MAYREFKELKLCDHPKFCDERGFFFESFNQTFFENETKINTQFVQDNVSYSKKNVLRGFHYQCKPFEQGKLVRVLDGAILDVVVDVRRNSEYFGDYFHTILSKENNKSLWIPEGFAHGFLALEEENLVSYKTTNYYSKTHEISFSWDDKDINFNWPVKSSEISLSEKDSNNITKLLDFRNLK